MHVAASRAGCEWADLDARRGGCPRSRSQGFTGPDHDSGSRAAADRGDMHSGEGPCADVENETIVVSFSGRGSHDCAGDSALHGGADGREDSGALCRPQSDAYGARCSRGRDSRSGTGNARVLKEMNHMNAVEKYDVLV